MLLTLFLLLIPAASAEAVSGNVTSTLSYSKCAPTFDCGPLRNLSYPFTGGDRPAVCGPPEFRLTCHEDSAELTTASIPYKVLTLDQTSRSLTLARSDLYNNTCLSKDYVNTTLNTTIFTSDPTNVELTLFYDCNTLMNLKPDNLFYCEINGTDTFSYYLMGPVPSNPILNVSKCNMSITDRILPSTEALLAMNRSLLKEALMVGFAVNYSNPYDDHCAKCRRLQSECGFDSVLGTPNCICGDQICPASGPKSRLSVLLPALLTPLVLAVITSIFLVIRRHNLRHHSPTTSQIGENIFDVENFINGIAPRKYTYSELKRMSNSFSIKLGQGGYGSVYKGSLKDGHPVAVKILNVSKESSGEDFFNEVASISRTAHVNVVALLGFCYERKRRALVYEFMPNGSLDKFISTKGDSDRSSTLECKVLYQITLGIARGLEYLHRGCNTRIVHFDIKPHNILLDQDLVPKISDFGLAKLWQGKESMVSMQGTRGTIGYIAPEVFCRNFGGVSHKSDVYSYGMLVLDMVCGRYNFDARVSHTSDSDAYFPDWIYREYLQLGKDITLNEITTEEEEEITRKMIIVGLWCIQNRPSDRPSIKEVIEMLEGSTQALQVPLLKPFQASPERLPELYSTTSSSSFNGNEKISKLEPEARAVN